MIIIRPITITDAILTDTNVAEDDYAEYNVGTTYADGDHCIDSSSGVHKIYKSLQDANTGNALTDTTWWLEVSATNRWKAFDGKVGSQTSQATSITFEITPGEIVDSIAFLNLDAETVQIVSTDPTEGEVYNKTVDLTSTIIVGCSGIYDWYSYFFSSEFLTVDIVKLDLPLYLSAVLTITITFDGRTAAVGDIILGVQANIGNTQYSPSIGIHDYSIKEQDAFGIWSVTERSFSKKMSCDITIVTDLIAYIQNLLASYRTTPLVWIGSVDYPSMIVYGFCKDFSILIGYPDYAICNIEIEGLT